MLWGVKYRLPYYVYLCTDMQIDLVHLLLVSVGKMLSCALSGGQRLYYTRMAASSPGFHTTKTIQLAHTIAALRAQGDSK